MKVTDIFPSMYLKSEDLQDRDITVTIAGVSVEEIGEKRKIVLSFEGKKKTMICNKTNANRITLMYGDETDSWVGQEIVLTTEFVEFQGRTIKGLRVKASTGKRANSPRQNVVTDRGGCSLSETKRPAADEPDEEIPF